MCRDLKENFKSLVNPRFCVNAILNGLYANFLQTIASLHIENDKTGQATIGTNIFKPCLNGDG